MFPANKGFESAACPFYQHGLCDRPYCPFAHVVKRTPRTKPQPQPKAPIRPMQQNIASGYYEATQSSKVDRYDSKNSSNVGRFDDSTSGSSRDVEIKVVEVGETRTPREGPTVLSSSPFAISPARPSNPDTVPQPTVKPVRKTQDPLHTDKPNPYKAGDTPNTTQETRKRPHTSAGTHTAELDPTEQRRRQSVTKGKGFMREAQLNLEAMRKKPRLDPPVNSLVKPPRVAHTVPSEPIRSTTTAPVSNTFTSARANKIGGSSVRVAHTVSATQLSKPAINIASGSKIPVMKRQGCLDKLAEQLCRIYEGDIALGFQEALVLEEGVYEQSPTTTRYFLLMRKELSTLKATKVGERQARTLQSAQDDDTATQENGTNSANNYRPGTPQQGSVHCPFGYQDFLSVALTPDLLALYQYPGFMAGTDLSVLATTATADGEEGFELHRAAEPIHTCSRCQTKFQYPAATGEPQPATASEISCKSHPSKAVLTKVHDGREFRYACCGEMQGTTGCVENSEHVFTREKTDVTGFMCSPFPPQDGTDAAGNENSHLLGPRGSPFCIGGASADVPEIRTASATSPMQSATQGRKVWALDCEMCYNRDGLELTRVTIVDEHQTLLMDELIKPSQPVIDYNTRFSGIRAEDIDKATMTMDDVHKYLKENITTETVLIGHSLDSDLRALKLIHPTVVDTSELFPHRRGLPFRYGLKILTKEHLKRFIQQETGQGHDSKEDAVAALELVIHRLGENKRKRELSQIRSNSIPTSIIQRQKRPSSDNIRVLFNK